LDPIHRLLALGFGGILPTAMTRKGGHNHATSICRSVVRRDASDDMSIRGYGGVFRRRHTSRGGVRRRPASIRMRGDSELERKEVGARLGRKHIRVSIPDEKYSMLCFHYYPSERG